MKNDMVVCFTDGSSKLYQNASLYPLKNGLISIVEGENSTLMEDNKIKRIKADAFTAVYYKNDRVTGKHIIKCGGEKYTFDTQEEAFEFMNKLGV